MSADDARKLFVGGLSDAATEEELRGVFVAAGFTVAHLAMPRDRETGRLRGFAFVTLGTEEEAKEARSKVQGVLCGGRPLSVREFSQGSQKSAPRPRGDEPTVFLGKLPFDATQEEIGEFFASAGLGPVVRVTLPMGPDGRPRGFGFATLESSEAANRAVAELNGSALRGRNIVVSPAQPRGRTNPGPGRTTSPRREGGDAASYESGNYQSRGPRAVPREPEPSFYPEELPPFPPDDQGEGRRRRTEPKKKERGSDRKRGTAAGEGGHKTGRRRRGGASSWQQWDSDDD